MDCIISKQIAKHCDEPQEVECNACHGSMTIEEVNGYDLLVCDDELCGHKVWADGEEFDA